MEMQADSTMYTSGQIDQLYRQKAQVCLYRFTQEEIDNIVAYRNRYSDICSLRDASESSVPVCSNSDAIQVTEESTVIRREETTSTNDCIDLSGDDECARKKRKLDRGLNMFDSSSGGNCSTSTAIERKCKESVSDDCAWEKRYSENSVKFRRIQEYTCDLGSKVNVNDNKNRQSNQLESLNYNGKRPWTETQGAQQREINSDNFKENLCNNVKDTRMCEAIVTEIEKLRSKRGASGVSDRGTPRRDSEVTILSQVIDLTDDAEGDIAIVDLSGSAVETSKQQLEDVDAHSNGKSNSSNVILTLTRTMPKFVPFSKNKEPKRNAASVDKVDCSLKDIGLIIEEDVSFEETEKETPSFIVPEFVDCGKRENYDVFLLESGEEETTGENYIEENDSVPYDDIVDFDAEEQLDKENSHCFSEKAAQDRTVQYKSIVDKPLLDRNVLDQSDQNRPILHKPILNQPRLNQPVQDQPLVDKRGQDKSVQGEDILNLQVPNVENNRKRKASMSSQTAVEHAETNENVPLPNLISDERNPVKRLKTVSDAEEKSVNTPLIGEKEDVPVEILRVRSASLSPAGYRQQVEADVINNPVIPSRVLQPQSYSDAKGGSVMTQTCAGAGFPTSKEQSSNSSSSVTSDLNCVDNVATGNIPGISGDRTSEPNEAISSISQIKHNDIIYFNEIAHVIINIIQQMYMFYLQARRETWSTNVAASIMPSFQTYNNIINYIRKFKPLVFKLYAVLKHRMKNMHVKILHDYTVHIASRRGVRFSTSMYLVVLYIYLDVEPERFRVLRDDIGTSSGNVANEHQIVQAKMLKVVRESLANPVSGASMVQPQNLPHTSTSAATKTDDSSQIPAAQGVQSSVTNETLRGVQQAGELSNNVTGMNERQMPVSYARGHANQQNPGSVSNTVDGVNVQNEPPRSLGAPNNLPTFQTQFNSASANVTGYSGVGRSPHHTSSTLTTNVSSRNLELSCRSTETSGFRANEYQMEQGVNSSERVGYPSVQPPRTGVNERQGTTGVASQNFPENGRYSGRSPTTGNDQPQFSSAAIKSFQNLLNSRVSSKQQPRLNEPSGTNVYRTQTNSTISEALNVPANKETFQSANVSTNVRQQDIRTSHSYQSQSQNHQEQNTSHAQAFQYNNVNPNSNLVTRNPSPYRPLRQQILPTNSHSTSGHIVVTGQQNMNRPTYPQNQTESRTALMSTQNTSNQLIQTNVRSSTTPPLYYHPSNGNNVNSHNQFIPGQSFSNNSSHQPASSSQGARLQQTSNSNHSSTRTPQQHQRSQVAYNNNVSANNPGIPQIMYPNTPRSSHRQPVPLQVQTPYTSQMTGSQGMASTGSTLMNTNSNMTSLMHNTSQQRLHNGVPYNTTVCANTPVMSISGCTNSPRTSTNFPISTQSNCVTQMDRTQPRSLNESKRCPNMTVTTDQIPYTTASVSQCHPGSSNVIPGQRTGLTQDHLAHVTHMGGFQKTSSTGQSTVPNATLPVDRVPQHNRQYHEPVNNRRDLPGFNQTVQPPSSDSLNLKALLRTSVRPENLIGQPTHPQIPIRNFVGHPAVVQSSHPQQQPFRNSVPVSNLASGAHSGTRVQEPRPIPTSFTQSSSQTASLRVSEPTRYAPTSRPDTHSITRALNPNFPTSTHTRGNANTSVHTELPSNHQENNMNNTEHVQNFRKNPVNLNTNLNHQHLNNRNLYPTSTMGNPQTSPSQLETSYVGNVRNISTYSDPSSQQHRAPYAAQPALRLNPTSSVPGAQENGEAYRTATDDAEVISTLTRKDFHSSRQSLDSGVGLWSPATSEPRTESPGNTARTPVASHAGTVSGGQELATVADDDDDDEDSDGLDELQCVCCSNAAEVMCSGCKARFYCTVECQKRDWKDIHELVCGINTTV